jgi:Uma2 family endonuclease
MGMSAIRRRWNVADVRALASESRHWPRYELIGLELLVTPAPGSVHQIAVTELWSTLNAFLERQPLGIAMLSPADLELRPGTIVQPDLFVVPAGTRMAGKLLAWSDSKRLTLAVEVLSPTSARTDRVEKRDFYMDSAVDEYWIVDLEARVIERWTPGDTSPVIVRDTLEWDIGDTRCTIDVADFFRRVILKASLTPR